MNSRMNHWPLEPIGTLDIVVDDSGWTAETSHGVRWTHSGRMFVIIVRLCP